MKLKQLQIQGIKKLQEAEINEPRRKVNLLLAYLQNTEVSDLIKLEDKEVSEEVKKEFEKNLKKLTLGYPIQYITHKQEFMKLPFYVDESVLIPQPDTEILVEETLKEIEKYENVKILDLCTGSGCIGISIAQYAKNVEKVTLADISKDALVVARKNACLNNVENKVEFVRSDLFTNITGLFDGIVSNPPYIKRDVISNLDLEVQREPHLALDGGLDGLDFYKKILENADKYLNPKGFLFLEIGYDQKDDVKKIWEDLWKSGRTKLNHFEERKDLAGLDRVIMLRSE